jgi:hypothetical protein
MEKSESVVKRRLPIVMIACVLACALGAAARQSDVITTLGQTSGPRDPARPQTREVPVGTASIAGIVTAAGTGRALPGTRLMLSGASSIPAPMRAGSGARGRGGGQTLGLTRSVVTDEAGRFTIDALPAGQFTLSAVRDQYLSMAYGATKSGRQGTAIRLADGQRFVANIALPRGGVISGSVYGQDGEPLIGAQVRALRFTLASGVKRLASSSFATTDDRGTYRVFNLAPGAYLIAATPSPSSAALAERSAADEAAIHDAYAAALQATPTQPPSVVSIPAPQPGNVIQSMSGYAPTFYPNTPIAGTASVVTVDAAEERSGVDVTIVPVRTVDVRGVVAGVPAPNLSVQISLSSDDPMAVGVGLPSARAGADGAFMLRNVPPGEYTAFAQTMPPINLPANALNGMSGSFASAQPPKLDDSQRLWARAHLTVDGQSSPMLAMSLQPGRTVSGTVVVQSASSRPAVARRRVILTSAPTAPSVMMGFNGPPQSDVGADGQFTLTAVFPGEYRLQTSGGFTKSVVVNGEETMDSALVVAGDGDVSNVVVTVTDQLSELSGTLTESSGTAATEYTIVVASADRRYWTAGSRRIMTSRPAVDGHFIFRGLPAGDYLLAAVTDIEPGGQYDPDFLAGLAAAAVRVTMPDGGKQVQDIRVAR